MYAWSIIYYDIEPNDLEIRTEHRLTPLVAIYCRQNQSADLIAVSPLDSLLPKRIQRVSVL